MYLIIPPTHMVSEVSRYLSRSSGLKTVRLDFFTIYPKGLTGRGKDLHLSSSDSDSSTTILLITVSFFMLWRSIDRFFGIYRTIHTFVSIVIPVSLFRSRDLSVGFVRFVLKTDLTKNLRRTRTCVSDLPETNFLSYFSPHSIDRSLPAM